MKQLPHLFDNNRQWAAAIRESDPEFFATLARQQRPEYLWIGCSDSRVPANEIVGLLPGELFVHRNVANLVVHSDLNCLSVLQFAVDVLDIKHVIVCGHYRCGGVMTALEGGRHGLVDNWLGHIGDLIEQHRARLDAVPDSRTRGHLLCELNVIEQVAHVCRTTVAIDAWAQGKELAVHGWIYDVADGLLRDLDTTVSQPGELQDLFESAIEGAAKRYPREPYPSSSPSL